MGNGSPWVQKFRSPGGGDNLFGCSILALDATTGRYKWHYQFVPSDAWDYDAVMDIALAELTIGGKLRKVAMIAPKNGFFYVFDRVSGRLVRTVPNPSGTAYQDIKFVGNHLVAGGTRGPLAGSLDWLSWPALRVGRSLHAGLQGQIRPFGRGGPYTGEGMAIDGRDLYLLPEDGPSHLFRFRLDV